MPSKIPEIIYPCPFSKSYGIPGKQAWLILKIYFIYRFILACLLLILYLTHYGPSQLGSHDNELYKASSGFFLLFTFLSGIGIFQRLIGYTTQAQLLLFTDIIVLTLIMHASGGIVSGLGILLVVTTAAGGLLIGGRCAMLFAAFAALAILTEQVYSVLTQSFATTSYTYAGLLGAAFFAISLIAFILAKRTEQTEQLAAERKQTISKLEKLNKYIIRHLKSGIVIVNDQQKINLCNDRARLLFGLSENPETLTEMEPQLAESFNTWVKDQSHHFYFLQPDKSNNDIQIHFQELPTQQENYYLLLLEDMAEYNQRLQQSKLASLGKLTASIAHEIRNPLGAISHAGQLLSECPSLSQQDQRFTEIIQTQSARVNKIIEDILQLSRRKASKREKINLSSWLPEFLHNFSLEQQIDSEQVTICTINPTLNALIDPAHLKQILDNLFCNAFKYGNPENGKISLQCYSAQAEILIDVIDPGSGIPEKNIDRLFEPFFTTSTTGTGLGLYISRELAQLNQAKLSYHYLNKKQSCFRLSLENANKISIEI